MHLNRIALPAEFLLLPSEAPLLRSQTAFNGGKIHVRKVQRSGAQSNGAGNQEAQRFNHEYVGTEHILLGLVKSGDGDVAGVLGDFDIDLRKVRLEVEKRIKFGPNMVTVGKLPPTLRRPSFSFRWPSQLPIRAKRIASAPNICCSRSSRHRTRLRSKSWARSAVLPRSCRL